MKRLWFILLGVVIGAIVAGGLLAIQYAKQQVPKHNEALEQARRQ